MTVTFVGVRHHSPACARLVAATIAAQRPAYVLVEGPADMNDRLDELLLGHELPIAIYSCYRDGERVHGSWSPLCEYSPEWVALAAGRRRGAQVRFIDLPAWHPAFAGRENRYADAELRYADTVGRLCRHFAVDNVDTLWDHLVEVEPDGRLEERLATYFDLVRGQTPASAADTEREAYMASWVRAAVAHADGRPVVVVTGGFHRPPLVQAAAGLDDAAPAAKEAGCSWPPVPRFPPDAVGGSYLVPYSFKRLDAFDGYQSGLPSPGYYQWLWESGLDGAAASLVETVVRRLRKRRQPVSTADLIAARAMAGGLARLRGHRHPARTDVLDGLVSALVSDVLDVPLPWTVRGGLRAGTDPAVVEMVAALSGDRVGRLHPDTPLPPLVPSATAELEGCGTGDIQLDLTAEDDRARSRTLHRLRVLAIPGVRREVGPSTGADPVLAEQWTVSPSDLRLPALIEAGAYGVTLADAARAALAERVSTASGDIDLLASILFDSALSGLGELSDQVLARVGTAIASVATLGPLGHTLAVVLGLWRHDRLFGTAHSPTLGAVIQSSVIRILWLAEGVHGGPAPADVARLGALVAARDAIRHAGTALELDREAALAVMRRLAADATVPPDLRGAALGFGWSLSTLDGKATVDPVHRAAAHHGSGSAGSVDAVRAVQGAARPETLGDFLAGLFALAREEVLAAEGSDSNVLAALDVVLADLSELDFLAGLPALRQAFAFFPPREREAIAQALLDRRGRRGSARALLRVAVPPELLAEAAELEARVDELMRREGLLAEGVS